MAEENGHARLDDGDGNEQPSRPAPASGCPYSGSVGASEAPASDADESAGEYEVERPELKDGVTYDDYLQIPSLLKLQHPRTEKSARDETFFIIIHQTYELWFKQLILEMEAVVAETLSGDLREAHRLMERVLAIEVLLVKQIHLLETLSPRDFGAFRNAIRPASGFESGQFREVEFMTGLKEPGLVRVHEPGSPIRIRLERRLEEVDIKQALYSRMRDEGFALPDPVTESNWKKAVAAFVPIYRNYEQHWEMYRLCESLLSHDQWLLTWRFHHVRVVERIIGMKSGTGGSPGVKYLERTLRKRAFPILIEARTMLDDDELFSGYTRK